MHSKNYPTLRLLLFGFLLLGYANTWAQQKVIVNGYVHAQKTKETIAGVMVIVAESSTGTVSNSYGFYSLDIPANKKVCFTFRR